MTQATFTVPASGTYTSRSNGGTYHFNSGKIIPLDLAIDLQMPGASAPAVTSPFDVSEDAWLAALLATGVATAESVAAAALATFQTQVPLLTDLCAETLAASISATASVPVFIAPFPCKVTWAAIANWATGTIAADDTNYWSVAVRRTRTATTINTIVTKTSQLTGGQAITQKLPWDYSALTFDASYQILAAGDVIDFLFTKNGTAASLASTLLQIRYEPT